MIQHSRNIGIESNHKTSLLLGMYVPCLNVSHSKLTEHTCACLKVMNVTRLDRWPLFMAQTSIERSLLALYKVKV